MDKQNYIEIKSSINNRISSLKNERDKLDKKYISENQKFPIGTKVTYGEEGNIGWIAGYDIFMDEVIPLINPAKKDGEKSSRVISAMRLRGVPVKACDE